MSTAKKNACLAAGVLLALFAWYYRSRLFIIVKPLLWGVIFAVLFAPIAKMIEKKLPTGAAVGIIYGTIFVSLGVLAIFGLPAILQSVKRLGREIPNLWQSLTQGSGVLASLPEAVSWAEERLPGIIEKVGAWDAVSAAGKELGKLFIGLVLSAYLLKDRTMLTEEFFSLFPNAWGNEVKKISREMAGVFGVYLRGRLLLSVAVGLLSWPVFYCCGVPHAGLFAVLFGLLDILPFFGPLLAATPAVLLALSKSGPGALVLASLLFLIEEAESLFLQPKLIGGALKLHPATAILAVLFGTVSFGFFGAVLSIPLFSAGKILVKRIFYHVV